MNHTKLESNDDVKRVVRNAIVEVHMLKQVNKPLAEATLFPLESQFDFSSVTFVKAENGIISIENSDIESKSSMLDAMTYPDKVTDSDEVAKSDAAADMKAEASTDMLGKVDVSREALESHLKFGDIAITQDFNEGEPLNPESTKNPVLPKVEDEIWMGISLEDQMMKFAVSPVLFFRLESC